MAGDGEQTPSVLLVDDDRGIRSLLTIALADAGWTVTEASNGYTGLRRAEQEAPDVILLDLALPEVDGLSVLDELRRLPATRAIPVVAMTGHPDWLADRAGSVSAVLPKPFDLDDAIGTVRRVLAQARKPVSPIPPATTGLHERLLAPTARTAGPSLVERA